MGKHASERERQSKIFVFIYLCVRVHLDFPPISSPVLLSHASVPLNAILAFIYPIYSNVRLPPRTRERECTISCTCPSTLAACAVGRVLPAKRGQRPVTESPPYPHSHPLPRPPESECEACSINIALALPNHAHLRHAQLDSPQPAIATTVVCHTALFVLYLLVWKQACRSYLICRGYSWTVGCMTVH